MGCQEKNQQKIKTHMIRYDLISEDYDKFRVEYPENFIKYLIINLNLNKNSNVCDLGCGTGKFSKRIINNISNIDGVDTSSSMLNIASKLGAKFRAINKDANIFFSPNTYDTIFLSHSFHWLDKRKVLDNIYKSLKQEGDVAIFWNNSLNVKKEINKDLIDLVNSYSIKKPIVERRGTDTKDILFNSELFKNIKTKEFRFTKEFSTNEYLGLLKSKSYVSDEIPKEKQVDFFNNAKEILIQYGDCIVESYCTDLYLAKKK